MSHDGLTEETKAIIKSLETDDDKAQDEKPKESHKNSGVKDDIQYETNTEEDLDSEW